VSRCVLFLLVSALPCSAASGAPVADFTAPLNVAAGSPLFVDASLSQADPGNSLVLYEWQWSSPVRYQGQSAEDFSFTSDATGLQQSHVFGAIGSFRVTLRITDDQSDMAIAQKDILVEARRSPVAVHTVSSYEIDAGTDLFLDGSASYDPDAMYGDSIVSYKWILQGRTLVNSLDASVSMPWANLETALVSGGYPRPEDGNIWETIYLRVTDTTGRYHEAPALLHINPVPEPTTMGLLALGGLTMLRRGKP